MKCSARFKVLTGTVSFFGLIILLLVMEDKCETYDLSGFIWASVTQWMGDEQRQPLPLPGGPRDKMIVVSAMEDADVSWVTDELPE